MAVIAVIVYVPRTSVEWIGPPPVVIQTRGKTCIVQMKSSMAMLMMIGVSCGMVMLQNFCTPLAPSMVAASYKSTGMTCRPAIGSPM